MAVTVDLGVAELAATRFAISPLSETVSALQQLGHRQWRDSNLRWLRWASDQLAARPLDLTHTWPLIVSDRPSWPGFLVPAPIGADATIEDDLDAVRRTTADQVRASLRRVFGTDLPSDAATLAARPPAGLRANATELRTAHDLLIAPHWSRIRAVLDADIGYRARQLATGGAQRLFADVHPDLHWQAGRLTVDHRHRDRVVNLGPGGLVLMPVVLGSGKVLMKGHTTTQTTVRYPARGIGTLWTAAPRRQCRQAARAGAGHPARGAAFPCHHHGSGSGARRHSQCGIATSRGIAGQRAGGARAVWPHRAVSDDRLRVVAARAEIRTLT